jgi:hypothetical protein
MPYWVSKVGVDLEGVEFVPGQAVTDGDPVGGVGVRITTPEIIPEPHHPCSQP